MAKRRRPPGDSVVVSIGEVRDMLREDTAPPEGATVVHRRELPVPLAVPSEIAQGVPTMEEIRANREARWQEPAIIQAPRIEITSRRVRLRRPLRLVAAGLIGLGVAAGAAAALWPTQRPMALAPVVVEQARRAALAEGQVKDLRGALRAAEERAEAAEAEGRSLRAQVAEALAELQVAREQRAAAQQAEARVSKAHAHRRRRHRARRRRATRRSRQDKRIDDLINGL